MPKHLIHDVKTGETRIVEGPDLPNKPDEPTIADKVLIDLTKLKRFLDTIP